MDRRFNAEFCVLCSRSLKCKNQYIPIQPTSNNSFILCMCIMYILILDTLFKYKIVRKIEKNRKYEWKFSVAFILVCGVNVILTGSRNKPCKCSDMSADNDNITLIIIISCCVLLRDHCFMRYKIIRDKFVKNMWNEFVWYYKHPYQNMVDNSWNIMFQISLR